MSSRGHLTAARALLGAYVGIHFSLLVPYAEELFSRRGMLPDGSLSPLLRAFPNVLALWDGPAFVRGLVLLGACAGFLLAAGVAPRLSALAAYYVWACLFGRNPLIANPSLPYVGLMLLACAATPAQALAREEGAARLRRLLWIAMALGYSYSGLTKLAATSWLDGSALHYVLENPLARPGPLRELLLRLPQAWLGLATYAVLALEVGFAPLSLSPRLRPLLWGTMLAVHVGLVALIQFADLSLAMVLLHLFTFDPGWLRRPGVTAASQANLTNLRGFVPLVRDLPPE